MTHHFMKIVPKVTPNADGQWRTIPPQQIKGGWNAIDAALKQYVPEGWFLAGYTSTPPAEGYYQDGTFVLPAPAEGVSRVSDA